MGEPRIVGNDHLRALKPILDECGFPWRAAQGSHHIKIYINEKMALVISRGKGNVNRRRIENAKAEIRRTVRELLQCGTKNP